MEALRAPVDESRAEIPIDAVILRVYYDPAQVANPTGSIVSPAQGATIGENPTLEVSATVQRGRPEQSAV